MTISLERARELQRIARINPHHAPSIIGDLIAEVNSKDVGSVVAALSDQACTARARPQLSDLPIYGVKGPQCCTAETDEQREQRLLDELTAVRKAQEAAAEAAKAEAAKKVRLDAILRAVDLSLATTDVLKAIFGQLDYNTGDVVSRDTWWKFRKELAPVVAAHGFKLVNVGTKSKPKAALAEV